MPILTSIRSDWLADDRIDTLSVVAVRSQGQNEVLFAVVHRMMFDFTYLFRPLIFVACVFVFFFSFSTILRFMSKDSYCYQSV